VVRIKRRAITVPTQATFTRVTVTEGQDEDNGKEVYIKGEQFVSKHMGTASPLHRHCLWSPNYIIISQ